MRRRMIVMEWSLFFVSLVLAIIITLSSLLWAAVWLVAPFVGVGAMLWWLWN